MSILNDREIKALCLKPTHSCKKVDFITNIVGTGLLHEIEPDVFLDLRNQTYHIRNEMGNAGYYQPIPITDDILESHNWTPMITPFSEKLTEVGRISHGLSSFGYDATLGPKLKIARQENVEGIIFDPKNVDPNVFEDFEGETFVIPPHGFALGYTNEVFDIPDDVLSICMAKSTYARGALIVGVTPLEPGWRGQVTLEFSNTLDIPIRIYANEGICQFLFFRGGSRPDVTYNQRGGKYMDQEGIVLSRILK